MNRAHLIYTFAWIGTFVGLMSSAFMAQKYPMSMYPDPARWALMSTLLLMAVVLAVLLPNSREYAWWHRASAFVALGGWVLLLSGYPLWGLGKYYTIDWSLTAYTVLVVIVYEYSQQLRKQQAHWPIITRSQIVPLTIGIIAGIHILLLLNRDVFPVSTFCFLTVSTTCGIVSAFAARRVSRAQ